MDILINLLLLFLLGILPACLWLWFWLRQDKAHPEPPQLIIKTFGFGVLSAIAAFVLQHLFNYFFNISGTEFLITQAITYTFFVICVWAFIEEIVKYIAAWYGGLSNSENNESIDAPIYMISAAIGFAAIENTLFLIEPLLITGTINTAIATAQIRFIGSTLVHIASSGLLGMFIGYSFFFMRSIRKRYFGIGLILATLLHGLFNLFIIRGDQNSFIGFLIIWLFIILLIVLFEYIKKNKVTRI